MKISVKMRGVVVNAPRGGGKCARGRIWWIDGCSVVNGMVQVCLDRKKVGRVWRMNDCNVACGEGGLSVFE